MEGNSVFESQYFWTILLLKKRTKILFLRGEFPFSGISPGARGHCAFPRAVICSQQCHGLTGIGHLAAHILTEQLQSICMAEILFILVLSERHCMYDSVHMIQISPH